MENLVEIRSLAIYIKLHLQSHHLGSLEDFTELRREQDKVKKYISSRVFTWQRWQQE